MSATDDLLNAARRVIGDKPVFLLAGAGDLVNEKLRELPSVLGSMQDEYRDVPMKAAGNLAGQLFRANLKLGELYDDLTRRGEDVVAKMRGEPRYDDGDEPFVREPYMPEPVHPVAHPPVVQPPKAVVKKAAAQKAPAKRAAKKASVEKVTAKKAATTKTAAKKSPATKAAGKKSTATKAAGKKTAAKRQPRKA